MRYFLPTLIFFLLALEGLGVQNGREATIFLIILLFPVLFIHMLFHKQKFVYPKKISILFLVFLGATFITTFLGLNVSHSLEYSLYLLSLFFVFILSYNYKKELEKPLIIFTLSVIFSLYSLLLNSHLLNLFLPQTGYQFVFSRFGSHNHLGDFLVLSVIICLYYLFNKSNKLTSPSLNHKSSIINHSSAPSPLHPIPHLLPITYLLFSIPCIFFSYSRSAYMSLALTVIFMLFYLQKQVSKHKWILRICAIIVVLITAFLVIAITPQGQKQPLSSEVNKYLVQKENLKYKELLGDRLEYTYQALISFQKHPVFGVGPNNFIEISKLYASDNLQVTEAAHNIFLEILVGQGILGFLPFAGLILLFLIKSQKNALYFAMLAMLINFQTDYTYQIYSFLLLFFVFAGIIYNEDPIPLFKHQSS